MGIFKFFAEYALFMDFSIGQKYIGETFQRIQNDFAFSNCLRNLLHL